MEFAQVYQEKREKIEELLSSLLPGVAGYPKTVVEAMRYSVLGGGKRLRPLLLQEFYSLFGGNDLGETATWMGAMECIHAYSLVHDDLPAMDNDTLRRGRKTTHVVYGEAMGILAGDGLLNYGYELIAQGMLGRSGETGEGAREKTTRRILAFQILSQRAGIYGMVGGQCLDVETEGYPIGEEVLNYIHSHKTGALLEAAILVGGVLAGATKEEQKKLSALADKLGMAFQIQDDILDVTGNQEELGKPIHSDEKNHKTTAVTFYGLEEAGRLVERYSKEALSLYDELAEGKRENPFLRELLVRLTSRKK